MGEHHLDEPPPEAPAAVTLQHEDVCEVGEGGAVGDHAREADLLLAPVYPETQRVLDRPPHNPIRYASRPVRAAQIAVDDLEIQHRPVSAHEVSVPPPRIARHRAAARTKTARARGPPSACDPPSSSSTVTTPSSSLTSLTFRSRPRTSPCSPRWSSIEASSSLTLEMRTRWPAAASLKGKDSSGSKVPSSAGIGSPCGSCSGCPRNSSRRSVNPSEPTCSNLSASSGTSRQAYPRCSRRKVSIRRCRRTSRKASPRPRPVSDAPL